MHIWSYQKPKGLHGKRSLRRLKQFPAQVAVSRLIGTTYSFHRWKFGSEFQNPLGWILIPAVGTIYAHSKMSTFFCYFFTSYKTWPSLEGLPLLTAEVRAQSWLLQLYPQKVSLCWAGVPPRMGKNLLKLAGGISSSEPVISLLILRYTVFHFSISDTEMLISTCGILYSIKYSVMTNTSFFFLNGNVYPFIFLFFKNKKFYWRKIEPPRTQGKSTKIQLIQNWKSQLPNVVCDYFSIY